MRWCRSSPTARCGIGARSTRSTQALAAKPLDRSAARDARRGGALPARPHARRRRSPSSIRRSTRRGARARPQAKALVNALLRRYLRERDALNAAVARASPVAPLVASALVDRRGSRRIIPQHWRDDPRGRQRAPAADAARQPPRDVARRAARALRGRGDRHAIRSASAGIVVREPRPVPRAARATTRARSRCRTPARSSPRRCSRVDDGMRVLDACAAPGGKTTHLLELADVELTALDSDAARLARVSTTISRGCGSTGRHVHRVDRRRGEPAALVGRPTVRPHPRRRSVHGFGRSCAGIRTASGCGARPTSPASPRSSARILDGLWPLARAGRPAAVRDLLGVRGGKRVANQRTSWPDARMRCANPSACRPNIAHVGGQLLPSAEGRGPQSGRLLLRAAPQGLRRLRGAVGGRAATLAGTRHRFAPACRLPSSRGFASASRRSRRRRSLAAGSRAVALASPPRRRRAPTRSRVNSAELRVEEGEVAAQRRVRRSRSIPTLEEALQSGIPLYFLLEFELTRSRAGTGSTRRCAQTSITVRASRYSALTRQYRVASGLLAQTFDSLEEVERYIGRVDVARRSRSASDARRRARATTPPFACGSTSESAAEAVPGQRARVARMELASESVPPDSRFTP